MFRPQLLAVLREIPEDCQQLRPKHVGAIINIQKHRETSFKVVVGKMYSIKFAKFPYSGPQNYF